MPGPAAAGQPVPDPEALAALAGEVMEAHWRAEFGFTMPNADVYPWMWLWDSCFHALVWDALGDDRAAVELGSVFTFQTAAGFVPHMGYQADPATGERLWGAPGHSTLTQPPMYGHALRVLAGHGAPVGHLAGPVRQGLRYLLERRRTGTGLLAVHHPWESGADDTPRWAAWQPDPFDRPAWLQVKLALLEALEVEAGAAIGSSRFDVCPASFNALVAWNALEAAAVLGDAELEAAGRDLARAVDDVLWDPATLTWRDVDAAGATTSATATCDALLPLLVTPDPAKRAAALGALVDPTRFGTGFGPAAVAPDVPGFDPSGYWRGATWPHLTYLFWRGAEQHGHHREAATLEQMLVQGAAASGFAEYWDCHTGRGAGARPQSWTALAVVPGSERRRRAGGRPAA